MQYRDVTTGATGATEVGSKFSDTLTLSQPRGQILSTITEVASNIFLLLRPYSLTIFTSVAKQVFIYWIHVSLKPNQNLDRAG